MEQFSTLVAADALRYAVPASLAFLVFWWWKWDALAHRRIQQRRPSRAALRREVAYSISTVLIFACIGYATVLLQQHGMLELYQDVDTYGWPYWIASIVLAIVIHDAYFYWTHRTMHHRRLFRAFHRVHHLSTSPSPWAAYAFAPAEAVVEALVVPVILVLLPMHPAALFVFLIWMILMNVNAHLGFELCPRWFTRSRWTRAFTTSTHHNLHHRDFHGNYGFYFTWWDRLMGTQHPEYHETFDKLTGEREAAAAPI